jgi:pimeloyl-ACP methyl ester carboxylesterase
MNFIELDCTSTRYERGGTSGPLVVLIHEMGGMLESWDEVVPVLNARCRTLRYDFRGAGIAERIRGDVGIETFSNDLLHLLGALAIDEPVILAGCAVGAAIALEFAGTHQNRVAGLIAMSPAIDMAPEDRAGRLDMLETILQGGMRTIMEGALSAGYPQKLRDADPERFRRFKARWLSNDPESFVATYKMLVHMDIEASIAAITCPTLGLAGSLDSFRPPEYVRKVLTPIADLELKTIETCHHQPAATPQPVAAAIRDFIDRRFA